MRSQARRPGTLRIPLWTVQLALLLLSAAIAVGVLWFALSLLLGMGTYIETVIP